jgi:hypothetical protein
MTSNKHNTNGSEKMKSRINKISQQAQKQLGWDARDVRNLKYVCRKLLPIFANEMLNDIEDLLEDDEPQQTLTVCQEMYREACKPTTRPVAFFDWNGAYVAAAVLGHITLAVVSYMA